MLVFVASDLSFCFCLMFHALRPIHTGRKRRRTRKICFMFDNFSLIYCTCSLIIFAFAFAQCEQVFRFRLVLCRPAPALLPADNYTRIILHFFVQFLERKSSFTTNLIVTMATVEPLAELPVSTGSRFVRQFDGVLPEVSDEALHEAVLHEFAFFDPQWVRTVPGADVPHSRACKTNR